MADTFKPIAAVRVATSTTVKRIALPAQARNARILNEAATIAWVLFDTGVDPVLAAPADDAVTSAIPVGPGATENFRTPLGATFVSVILPSGASASKLSITMGEGE